MSRKATNKKKASTSNTIQVSQISDVSNPQTRAFLEKYLPEPQPEPPSTREAVETVKTPLRIFLCHSSTDKPEVRKLYDRLRVDGFAPWLDETDLLPGQDWHIEITRAVKSADVVIVCLSHGAVTKEGYVQREIKLALDVADEKLESNIFIIPLRLEECSIPDRLSRWHWVNWHEEEGYKRLMLSLRKRAEMLSANLLEQLAAAAAQTTTSIIRQPAVAAPALLADLTINLFGPVEIYRDPKRPVPYNAWTTRRAHDILCFIASRKDRRASKDTIIDTFWGEADFDVVAKNFHPTMSHIRKALNSIQPLKQDFLLYRDSDYLLNPDFAYSIDIEEFDRLVAEGQSARRARDLDRCVAHCEAAIKLYRGEFMRGVYDEWVEEQRSLYHEHYIYILEILAVAAQKAMEWPRALLLAHQILRDDPYREDIYCLVMRTHAAQGNRAAVKDQYEGLCALLRKELGIQPASETQKVYQNLVG